VFPRPSTSWRRDAGSEISEVAALRASARTDGVFGLVPKENSTGEDRRLGRITKPARPGPLDLIEAVQHAAKTPKVSAPLARRQEGQPEVYRRIAWKTQVRLHKRHWHLTCRGVMAAKVKVALARELVGLSGSALAGASPKAALFLFRYKASEGIGERPSAGLALRDSPAKAGHASGRAGLLRGKPPFTSHFPPTLFCSLSAPPAAAVVRDRAAGHAR